MNLLERISAFFKSKTAEDAQKSKSQRIEKAYKNFDERYEDTGVFEYNTEGFTITTKKFTETIRWGNITKLNVYKVDLLTIDQIEMEIEYNDSKELIRITEELPGWYQFVLKTKEVFPTIPKDWDIDIINPAFERNYRTIYEKKVAF